MDEKLQDQLVTLGDEVRAAALPDGSRQTAAWCLGQLPALYAKFQQTNESRYGDEITRLVRGVLEVLAQSRGACPGAQRLAARLTDGLRLLHEQFGLPGLALLAPGAPSLRPRKAV